MMLFSRYYGFIFSRGCEWVRVGERFLRNKGLYLGDHGYSPDVGTIHSSNEGIIRFYHYTREERLESIFDKDSGLFARLKVDVCPTPPEEFIGCFMVEGFLEPLPKWLTDSPYFGDLGIEMVRKYIGNVLLEINVPNEFMELYVADYAHNLEAKHFSIRGSMPLNLGYDCSTGKEVTQAYVNSYIPVQEYQNRHIAPVMQALRKGQGIAIPREYIGIASQQPLK
jgi:hypothetical protein